MNKHGPETSIKGKIVIEWLQKWPDIPSKQLSRMIYNADNNFQLWSNADAVYVLIRHYKGANGNRKRETIRNRDHFKPLKQLTYVQPTEEL